MANSRDKPGITVRPYMHNGKEPNGLECTIHRIVLPEKMDLQDMWLRLVEGNSWFRRLTPNSTSKRIGVWDPKFKRIQGDRHFCDPSGNWINCSRPPQTACKFCTDGEGQGVRRGAAALPRSCSQGGPRTGGTGHQGDPPVAL